MARGIGMELDKDGKLQFAVREYDPTLLFSYARYREIKAYLDAHPDATLEEAINCLTTPTPEAENE